MPHQVSGHANGEDGNKVVVLSSLARLGTDTVAMELEDSQSGWVAYSDVNEMVLEFQLSAKLE